MQLTIALSKEAEDPEHNLYNEYYYAGGLVEYVKWLNTDKNPIHDVVAFQKDMDSITIDVALQWCSDAYSDTILGYANSIRTVDGGTHIDGFKASLTRTLNSLAKKSKANKVDFPPDKDLTLSGEHIREGLTCVVSVKVPNPEFEGQTKTRLGNPEVRRVVDQCVQEYITEYLELHPDVLDSILSKALNALKAALAAKRARELVRQKSVLRSSSLPGKLADCSATNPEEAEIFIVEGDSAGGSAKQGRDRRFQAILPLRGKILNVERRDDAAMYKNEEIQNLILALGLGVKGEEFKKDDLRYHKIIILTDADVDGAHIRTLLLTFFYRYQRALFDEGCIYVGVPPLYKVERGKHAYYCYNEAELKKIESTFPSNASYNIQRFKGLGEMMPLQLWETTLNPESRMLKRMTVEDAAQANVVLSSLMGARGECTSGYLGNKLIPRAVGIITLVIVNPPLTTIRPADGHLHPPRTFIQLHARILLDSTTSRPTDHLTTDWRSKFEAHIKGSAAGQQAAGRLACGPPFFLLEIPCAKASNYYCRGYQTVHRPPGGWLAVD
ncbi:hypothetical protein KSS87_010255 [Heliosperma pusillum]|nr:hypothetical protein KSS87_010255 [Heliosperma pusillum]